MPYPTILTDFADTICTITINRPDKLNALNTAMIHELIDAFDRADADDGVRAIIVTGAGRAFCAGADLSTGGGTFDRDMRKDRPQVPVGPDGKPDLTHDNARDGGGRITLRIFNCRKPVIAAVNGPAVGIGVTMLLPMDVRIASSEARFGFVFSQRGIVPEAASSYFLPRIVGISQALEWCYSGRVFGAEEALAGRLVSRVVPPDELMTTARARAFVHRQHRAGVGRADPADDVAHAGRRPPDGGASARQPRDVRSWPQRGREGGHRVVSGKAPGTFHRHGFGPAAGLAVGQ
jgi:enoyl-CoA hydratase/carnithine racemase